MARGRILIAVFAAVLAGWSLPAARAGATDPPAVVSERPESVSLVVYQSEESEGFQLDRYDDETPEYDPSLGLALVSEWRTIEVPAGEVAIRFQGVAEGIVPQTAALDGLPAVPVESNQDYDLLSPGSLIRRAVGTPVKRITTNPVTGRETVEDAILRSGPNGVILEVGGRFEALNCGGQPQRLVFDKPPQGLSDRPTLTLKMRVKTAGRYRVRLSYLATGLLWRAGYVMTLDAQAQRLDMTGWISLINTSGTTFFDAPTQVVAGDVERSDTTLPTEVEAEAVAAKCWPMDTTTRGRKPVIQPRPPLRARPTGDEDTVEALVITGSRVVPNYQDVATAVATQSELGDYKLYTLPFPTTVAAKQAKQVMMLNQPGVKVSWFHVASAMADDEFSLDGDVPEMVWLAAKTTNTRANGLGIPLPGGRLKMYQSLEGQPSSLIGDAAMMTVAVGAPLEFNVAEDPKVRVERETLSKVKKRDGFERRNRVVVVNDSDQAIVFEYRLFGEEDEPYRITAQSQRGRRVAGYTVWTLKVPAKGRGTLTFSVLAG